MKKIFILLIGIACFTTTYSQKKDITLEEIWKENQFYPKNFRGLNSMHDGEYYVKIYFGQYYIPHFFTKLMNDTVVNIKLHFT